MEVRFRRKSFSRTGTFSAILLSALLYSGCRFQSEKVHEISRMLSHAYGLLSDSVESKDMTYEGYMTYYDYSGRPVQQIAFTEYFKYPGMIRIEMDFNERYVIDAWDGVFAMEKIGNAKAEKINPKRFITSLRIKRFPYQFIHESFKFTVEEDEVVNGDSCYVLGGRFRGHESVRFYVDKRLGLLRRYTGRSHYGKIGRLTVNFEKYTQVNQRAAPSVITYYLNNKLYKRVEMEKIRFDSGLPDLHFNLVNDSVMI